MPIVTSATTVESLKLELDSRKEYIEDLEKQVSQLRRELSKLKAQSSIEAMTPMGIIVMDAIGNRRVSFFDDGISEGSGSWGTCLCGDTGARPGALTQLEKLGLLASEETDDEAGKWWTLTALGADVAQELAR